MLTALDSQENASPHHNSSCSQSWNDRCITLHLFLQRSNPSPGEVDAGTLHLHLVICLSKSKDSSCLKQTSRTGAKSSPKTKEQPRATLTRGTKVFFSRSGLILTWHSMLEVLLQHPLLQQKSSVSPHLHPFDCCSLFGHVVFWSPWCKGHHRSTAIEWCGRQWHQT